LQPTRQCARITRAVPRLEDHGEMARRMEMPSQ
jgi:hypothetical protein